MTSENPYQPPEADLDLAATADGLDEKAFRHLSRGQKLVIYAIVVYFFAFVSSRVFEAYVAGLIGIVALIMGLVGLTRILLGSNMGIVSKVLLFIAMFLPLLNFLALARINYVATKELKAAGYRVGFFGVKGRRID